jgi:hypothetical protein
MHSHSRPSSIKATWCVCNMGYQGPHAGPCESCPANTYKEVEGSAACTACPAGTYSSSTGATSARVCLTPVPAWIRACHHKKWRDAWELSPFYPQIFVDVSLLLPLGLGDALDLAEKTRERIVSSIARVAGVEERAVEINHATEVQPGVTQYFAEWWLMREAGAGNGVRVDVAVKVGADALHKRRDAAQVVVSALQNFDRIEEQLKAAGVAAESDLAAGARLRWPLDTCRGAEHFLERLLETCGVSENWMAPAECPEDNAECAAFIISRDAREVEQVAAGLRACAARDEAPLPSYVAFNADLVKFLLLFKPRMECGLRHVTLSVPPPHLNTCAGALQWLLEMSNSTTACSDSMQEIAPATLNNVSVGMEECRGSPTHHLLNVSYSIIRAACECFEHFTGVSCELHLLSGAHSEWPFECQQAGEVPDYFTASCQPCPAGT